MRPAIRPGAICLALLALSAACGERGRSTSTGTATADAARPRYGGTAVVAGTTDVADINPLTLRGTTGRRIAEDMLFTPMLSRDERLEPTPRLARSWKVSPDSTLLTFHLRDDVFWHDGVKTTAYDAKFTYDRIRDPETGHLNPGYWAYYGEAEAVDSFTFRVRMRPHADFLPIWSHFVPVPRHILGGVPAQSLEKHPFGVTRPVGNGPFRFVSRAPGERWVFEANDRYPEELGGRPYLDRIVYRVIPDQNTLLMELLAGGVHLIRAEPRQREAVERSGNTRVIPFRTPGFIFIVWNGRRPLFRDARVRRALTMAIDRREIIDGILYGHGDVANSTVPPMLWSHDAEAGRDLRHDPAAARRLLAEAGWVDRDGDGVIEDAGGRQFRFTIKTNQGNLARGEIAEKVQADLRKVGIIAEPRMVEASTLIGQFEDPRREFDAVLNGIQTGTRIDDTDLFHCAKRDGPWQAAGFCDPAVDRLLDTLPRIVNRSAAMPLWREYQRRIAQAQPLTLLVYPHTLLAVSDRLRDVNPDARHEWAGATRWWLAREGPSVTANR